MKKVLGAILSLIFVGGLFAQTDTAKVAAPKDVVLKKAAYSFKYPGGWSLSESTAKSFTVYAPSDGDGDTFTENINLVIYPIVSYLPKDYAQYSKTTLPQKIKNIKFLEEKEVKQGGQTGYYMVFKGVQGGNKCQWKQYYFIKNGIGHVITFTALETKYKEYIKKLAPYLASYKVL